MDRGARLPRSRSPARDGVAGLCSKCGTYTDACCYFTHEPQYWLCAVCVTYRLLGMEIEVAPRAAEDTEAIGALLAAVRRFVELSQRRIQARL